MPFSGQMEEGKASLLTRASRPTPIMPWNEITNKTGNLVCSHMVYFDYISIKALHQYPLALSNSDISPPGSSHMLVQGNLIRN